MDWKKIRNEMVCSQNATRSFGTICYTISEKKKKKAAAAAAAENWELWEEKGGV